MSPEYPFRKVRKQSRLLDRLYISCQYVCSNHGPLSILLFDLFTGGRYRFSHSTRVAARIEVRTTGSSRAGWSAALLGRRRRRYPRDPPVVRPSNAHHSPAHDRRTGQSFVRCPLCHVVFSRCSRVLEHIAGPCRIYFTRRRAASRTTFKTVIVCFATEIRARYISSTMNAFVRDCVGLRSRKRRKSRPKDERERKKIMTDPSQTSAEDTNDDGTAVSVFITYFPRFIRYPTKWVFAFDNGF